MLQQTRSTYIDHSEGTNVLALSYTSVVLHKDTHLVRFETFYQKLNITDNIIVTVMIQLAIVNFYFQTILMCLSTTKLLLIQLKELTFELWYSVFRNIQKKYNYFEQYSGTYWYLWT